MHLLIENQNETAGSLCSGPPHCIPDTTESLQEKEKERDHRYGSRAVLPDFTMDKRKQNFCHRKLNKCP